MVKFNKTARGVITVAFLSSIGLAGFTLGAISASSTLAYAKERYADLQIFTKVSEPGTAVLRRRSGHDKTDLWRCKGNASRT
jgi:hypothetical protein